MRLLEKIRFPILVPRLVIVHMRPASWRSGCMLISGADGLSVAERMRAHDQRDHRISEPRQRLHIMRLPTELSL